MAAVPEVAAAIKVIPAKRTATYAVPMSDDKRDDLVARVLAKDVTITGGIGPYAGQPPRLPKTIAAIDAARALLDAVREELIAQGITE